MGIEEKFVKELFIDTSDYSSTFLYLDLLQAYGNRAYKERMLWSLTEQPDFISNGDFYEGASMFMNIPLYTRYGNCTVDTVPFYILEIKMNDPSDHTLID